MSHRRGRGSQTSALVCRAPGETQFPSPAPPIHPTASCCLPRLSFHNRRNRPSLLVEIQTQPNQAVCREEGGEEGGAAAGTGGSTREWTDGRETQPRPPSVSDSRGPGGPPALMAQRDGAWVVGPESGGSRQGWL